MTIRDFEINSLNIMLAKTSAYIKNMIVKINGCFFFFIGDDD